MRFPCFLWEPPFAKGISHALPENPYGKYENKCSETCLRVSLHFVCFIL